MSSTNFVKGTGIPNGNSLNNVSVSISTLYALSFYSPIILMVSILAFGLFSSSLMKSFVYLFWVFVITTPRCLYFMFNPSPKTNMNAECNQGLIIPNDVSYSIYLLTFTMAYLIVPLINLSIDTKTNLMNYYVLWFFIVYIIFDLYIKNSFSCLKVFSPRVLADIVGGLGLGWIISGIIMYGTGWRGYLFINEVNSNKEVCSMPTKQQFRCSVYKNGEMVTSSIS